MPNGTGLRKLGSRPRSTRSHFPNSRTQRMPVRSLNEKPVIHDLRKTNGADECRGMEAAYVASPEETAAITSSTSRAPKELIMGRSTGETARVNLST